MAILLLDPSKINALLSSLRRPCDLQQAYRLHLSLNYNAVWIHPRRFSTSIMTLEPTHQGKIPTMPIVKRASHSWYMIHIFATTNPMNFLRQTQSNLSFYRFSLKRDLCFSAIFVSILASIKNFKKIESTWLIPDAFSHTFHASLIPFEGHTKDYYINEIVWARQ